MDLPNVMTESEYEAYLEHHGVKGMHWGIRRYQDYPSGEKHKGSFIGEKREPSKRQQRKAEKLKKKKFAEIQKARAKAEAEKKAAKEKAKKDEKIREKLLVSRDPEYIAKHMHLLSNQELTERISRLNAEATMQRLAKSKKKTGEQYIDSIIKWGNKANDFYKMLNSDLGQEIQRRAGIKLSTKDKEQQKEKALTAAQAKKKAEKERKQIDDAVKKALSDYTKSQENENNKKYIDDAIAKALKYRSSDLDKPLPRSVVEEDKRFIDEFEKRMKKMGLW